MVRVPPLGGMILKKTGTLRRPAKKKPAAEGAAKSTTRKASSAAKKATATKAATRRPPPQEGRGQAGRQGQNHVNEEDGEQVAALS